MPTPPPSDRRCAQPLGRRTDDHLRATATKLTAVAFTLLVGLLAFAGPAQAQDDEGEGEGDEEIVTEVRGVMRATDEEGETVLIEGVEFVITDEDGVEVGRGLSDSDGEWSVTLPGAGAYETLLVESTLPEGTTLRNPENNPLSYSVNEGASRANLFPLGEARVSDSSAIRAVQLFVDGIKLGLILAMASIGLSLIYGTTGLVNFSHAEMVTFGAMLTILLHVTGIFGWTTSLIVAAILAVALCGLAGGLYNQLVWKPLRDRGASLVAALVVSIGLSIFFRYVMLFFAGGRDLFFRDFRIQTQWNAHFFTIAPRDVFIIGFSTAVLLGVALSLQKTRAGKAMRAVSDNRDLAESSGIDVERVIRWVWVAGSALAGLGGVLQGATEAVGWEMGFRLLFLMFASVTLGGLGSAYGALVGGLIVGIFIQMSTLVIPNDMKNVGALLILILILLVRPQGLLGRAERVG